MEAKRILEEIMIKEWKWAPILVKIHLVEDKNIPTACIELDKLILRVNPTFFSHLDNEQKMFVIYHEIFHMLLEHDKRGEVRTNKKKWNVATDCEINSLLLRMKMKLVPGVITPDMFSLPQGELAEFYYEKLPNDLETDTHFSGILPDDVRETITKIKDQILNEIKQSGKRYGTNTIGKVIEFVELRKIVHKKLSRELQRFLSPRNETIDWRRESRRIKAPNTFFPRNREEEIVEAIVALDSSASINDNDFRFFIEVLKGTLSRFKFSIEVIQFDVSIKQCGIYKKIEKLNEIKRMLSGGTKFDEVIRYANMRKKKLIIFTDGDGELSEEIRVPILWILTDGDREELKGRRVVIR